ncbi:MAG: GIY-YIG nuclease family protein [Aquidulcibacter sp.]|jgi:hypothetical protein
MNQLTGYIYAIRCVDRVKIGHSIRPTERVEQIRPWCPFPMQIIGVKKGSLADEKLIHKALWMHRTHNEWFLYDAQEVQEFLATLGPYVPPVFYVSEKTESVARQKFSARWFSWRYEFGLSATDVNALRDGWAIPNKDLANLMEEKIDILASDWPSLNAVKLASHDNNDKRRLTEDEVLAIRYSDLRSARLAKQYNVSEANIRMIKTGKSWVHVV